MDTPKMGELKLSAKNRASKSNFTRSRWGLGKILPQVFGVTTSECF